MDYQQTCIQKQKHLTNIYFYHNLRQLYIMAPITTVRGPSLYIAWASFRNSDYRKRWRDVISQHPGHSHGYKSVMAALLKANTRYILFAQMTQNAKIFKSFVV